MLVSTGLFGYLRGGGANIKKENNLGVGSSLSTEEAEDEF